jgi:hypothetical protein
MSEIKEVQTNERINTNDSRKRYSAYMKKLNDLAKKNDKNKKGEK